MVDDFAEDEDWPVEKDPAFMYMPSSWDFNVELNVGRGPANMYIKEVEAEHQHDTAPEYMERQMGGDDPSQVACTLGCYPIEYGKILGSPMPEFGGLFINSGAWFNQIKQMMGIDLPTLDEDKLYYNVMVMQTPPEYEVVGNITAAAGLPLSTWTQIENRTELVEIPLWS